MSKHGQPCEVILEKRQTRQKAYERELTRKGQDIGPIPRCKNPRRRKKCAADFGLFCKTYAPDEFNLPWSKDQKRVIAKIQRVVINHDTLAMALGRGDGKSSLCRKAVVWASFCHKHAYTMFIAGTADLATSEMSKVKWFIANSDKLAEDFPEVCFAIRELEGENRRCLGQRSQGRRTNMQWSPNLIRLPEVKRSKVSGFVIEAVSLEGHIRGRSIALPNGKAPRPTLAVCDDPQTRESSRSQGPNGQTEFRLKIIREDVQGLAGPESQTAILVPCTVIEKGDLSDQILNRKEYPDFRGERTKRLVSWPRNKELWEEYREVYARAIENETDDGAEATEERNSFYRERMATCGLRMDEVRPCQTCPRDKVCMDSGAVVSWAERLDDPRNLSAVQATMHALFKYKESGFAAEFQNEPLAPDTQTGLLTAEQIKAKATGYRRGIVPDRSLHLTAGIDIGDDYLVFLIAAWLKNFTGSVIEYGTFPYQGAKFAKKSVKRSLADAYPRMGKEACIQAGLKDLINVLANRKFMRESGPPMQIELCLIDRGYKPEVVDGAIRQAGRGPAFRPSRGQGITAGKTQFVDYKRDRFREAGMNWWIPKDSPQAVIQIDTNFWKTFLQSRLGTAIGDPGSLTLFGKPNDHALFADHILAEYFTLPSTEKGVVVQEWHEHVGKDNELLDCCVMAAVAAAKLGCTLLPGTRAKKSSRRPMGAAKTVNSSFRPELG